ncbi:MAG TPA: hypothetical protein VNG51_25115 [Ktedonobacteraceae bacterium]|nr:hypothetical protein [Ktedonobacteraceae bacterium]
MNLFVDENIPQQVVAQLRAGGHRVEYVMRQVELQGALTILTESMIDIRRPLS